MKVFVSEYLFKILKMAEGWRMWAISLLTIMLVLPLLSAAPLDVGMHSHDENVTRGGKFFGHNQFDMGNMNISGSVVGDVVSIGHQVKIDVHGHTHDHHHHEADTHDHHEADSHEADHHEADTQEADTQEADTHEADTHEVDTHEVDHHEADHHEADTVIECREGVRILFQSIDSNKNGLMDAKELLSFCQQNNIEIPESLAVIFLTLPEKTLGFNMAKFCELLSDSQSTNSADLINFLLQLYMPAPRPPVTTPGKYNYKEVISKSLLFYEANRSGKLPKDNRVSWRGDSAMSDHIVGGYYDAGDHVKFGFPMASMTTILAWGAVSFPGGYEKAIPYQTDWMVKCLKWSTDYFMAAHTSANEFYGQVGDGNVDHSFWGRPEEMQMDRPAWKIDASHPGSDLAGETAAALAASAMYFRLQRDDSYADDCIEHAKTKILLTIYGGPHAKQLFQFANDHRGVYTDSIPAGSFYNSWSGYHDELVWAAAWLAKATQEKEYLDKAEELYEEFDLGGLPSEFIWDDKKAGAQLLMYELTGSNKYKTAVNSFLNYMWSCDTTPKGLIWISSSQWGSCRHASNLAHFAFQAAALGLQETEARDFGESQINYILGDGGRSYVVGWGDNPPKRPHHRSSSCPDRPQKCDWDAFNNPGPNYQTLIGALVGGPDHNDNYVDDRNNFQSNEVATDYNAGFQSSLAALVTLHG